VRLAAAAAADADATSSFQQQRPPLLQPATSTMSVLAHTWLACNWCCAAEVTSPERRAPAAGQNGGGGGAGAGGGAGGGAARQQRSEGRSMPAPTASIQGDAPAAVVQQVCAQSSRRPPLPTAPAAAPLTAVALAAETGEPPASRNPANRHAQRVLSRQRPPAVALAAQPPATQPPATMAPCVAAPASASTTAAAAAATTAAAAASTIPQTAVLRPAAVAAQQQRKRRRDLISESDSEEEADWGAASDGRADRGSQLLEAARVASAAAVTKSR